jgi:cytochrome c55X
MQQLVYMICVMGLFAGLPSSAAEMARDTGPLTPARTAELANLLRHDCGSCHGLTRKGGLGPPLTAPALAERTDDVLIETIQQGRPGSAMPPWGPLLAPVEVLWIVDQLRAEAYP